MTKISDSLPIKTYKIKNDKGKRDRETEQRKKNKDIKNDCTHDYKQIYFLYMHKISSTTRASTSRR